MIGTVAIKLRSAMDERGVTSTELAKRSNVKPSFIYDILNGKSENPSMIKLARVAESLGISLYFLLGQETPAEQVDSAHPDSAFARITTMLVDGFLGGDGAQAIEKQTGPYYFRKSWIRERLRSEPENLKMVFVRGDDMEPTLSQNDIVLVDVSKRNPTPAGLFVLYDGIGIAVKRLEYISQSLPAKIRVISDNPKYSTHERSMSDTHILGRVVWFAREL